MDDRLRCEKGETSRRFAVVWVERNSFTSCVTSSGSGFRSGGFGFGRFLGECAVVRCFRFRSADTTYLPLLFFPPSGALGPSSSFSPSSSSSSRFSPGRPKNRSIFSLVGDLGMLEDGGGTVGGCGMDAPLPTKLRLRCNDAVLSSEGEGVVLAGRLGRRCKSVDVGGGTCLSPSPPPLLPLPGAGWMRLLWTGDLLRTACGLIWGRMRLFPRSSPPLADPRRPKLLV